MWWIFSDPLFCALLVFTLNSIAYQTYILTGCLKSVDSKQKEAALALGMTSYQTFIEVIFPQGVILAIKPLGQELISLIKISCLANVITVFDLLGSAKSAYTETFNVSYLFIAGIIYIVIVQFTRVLTEKIYRKYKIPAR